MVDLNITADMTKEMVIAAAHKATAVPAMLTLYALFGVIMFLSGLAFKDKDSSWGRFFWIWAGTMFGVGVFLLFFIYSPTSIQWIVSKFNWAMS